MDVVNTCMHHTCMCIAAHMQATHTNNANDMDGLKHAFPSWFTFDNGLAAPGACAKRALVIIGDPVHSIASTTRRFQMDHINKLRHNAGLPKMSPDTFNILRETDRLDASAIIEFQRAWLGVRRPYVRVVTTSELYSNETKWLKWALAG